MVIVPLAGAITLCGFAMLAFQCVSYYTALCFVPVTELLVSLLLRANALLLSLPFACLRF